MTRNTWRNILLGAGVACVAYLFTHCEGAAADELEHLRTRAEPVVCMRERTEGGITYREGPDQATILPWARFLELTPVAMVFLASDGTRFPVPRVGWYCEV